MRYIDTHAHITDPVYDESRKQMLAQMREAGVWPVISIGADIGECRRSVALSDEVEGVYATVGLHPSNAQDAPAEDFLELERLAAHKGVVAIGEIGLDYHYPDTKKEEQKAAFTCQMELAQKLHLPVAIHSRDAMMDTLEILRKFPGVRGVVHCFSGSVESMKEVLKLGYYIALGGVVTFKNARAAVDVAREIPLDRLLLETDCPYLAPEPHRGTINLPLHVRLVAEKIAALRGISVEELTAQTNQNAKALFGLAY